jgi:SpoVK/Ycf46/Vps4 family AAA+-type ATPase
MNGVSHKSNSPTTAAKAELDKSLAIEKDYSSELHYEALLLVQRQEVEGRCTSSDDEVLQLRCHLSMLSLLEVASLSKQDDGGKDWDAGSESRIALNCIRFRDRYGKYIDVLHGASSQLHRRQQQYQKVQLMLSQWDSSLSDVEDFFSSYPECRSNEPTNISAPAEEGDSMRNECTSAYCSSLDGIVVKRKMNTHMARSVGKQISANEESTVNNTAGASAHPPPFTYRLSASTNSSPDEKHDDPPLQPQQLKQQRNTTVDYHCSQQVSTDPWQELESDYTTSMANNAQKTHLWKNQQNSYKDYHSRNQYFSSNQHCLSLNNNHPTNTHNRNTSTTTSKESNAEVQHCHYRHMSARKQFNNPFLTAKEVSSNSDTGGEGQYPHRLQQEQYEEDPCIVSAGPTLSAGLKRKFQPPFRRTAITATTKSSDASVSTHKKSNFYSFEVSASNSNNNNKSTGEKEDDDSSLPEALRGLDKELIQKITSEILQSGDPITFQDIAGLEHAKQTVIELICWPMKRPDLFTGLRKAPNGLLLYGPPGTGKTLIGKAIANESGATFFSISSSSMTSKWIGEGEKLVRTLFAVASVHEPSVVFIDEIDSLLTQRSSDENEASRRIKTEFLVQLDGTSTASQGRVLVIGATNRPHELDDAARRRFVKRIYVPLPTEADRKCLILRLLKENNHCLKGCEIVQLARDTEGFSGADLKALCTDAALGPIRELGPRALSTIFSEKDVPAISFKHFRKALRGTKPSVSQLDLTVYVEFDETYGTRISSSDSFDEEDEESPCRDQY